MLIWMQVEFAQPKLDAARPGRDASQIADEVISHLSGLLGANVMEEAAQKIENQLLGE